MSDHDKRDSERPPLCPGCGARAENAKGAGMVGIAICGPCADRSAAWYAAHPEPSPDHPAPWRWRHPERPSAEAIPEALELVDANGEEVLGADGDSFSWVACRSSLARELIRLAPELEALLREALPCVEVDGKWSPDAKSTDALLTVLAALDAARKTENADPRSAHVDDVSCTPEQPCNWPGCPFRR